MKPKIQIELVDKKGSCNCHRGHKIGDIWDFDTHAVRFVLWLCTCCFHTSTFYAMAVRCPE